MRSSPAAARAIADRPVPGGGRQGDRRQGRPRQGPKTGQAVPNSARNVWVTATSLPTALNTAYFAENVALFAIVMGIALLLIGIGLLVLTIRWMREPLRAPRVKAHRVAGSRQSPNRRVHPTPGPSDRGGRGSTHAQRQGGRHEGTRLPRPRPASWDTFPTRRIIDPTRRVVAHRHAPRSAAQTCTSSRATCPE